MEVVLTGSSRGRTVAAISNAIVRVHARAYGKGPTRANTHLSEGQYVLCLLRDPFTRGEKTLIAAGRADAVLEHRSAFYETVEATLRETVKELTGDSVVGYLPGVSVESDLVTQLFLLQPSPSNGSAYSTPNGRGAGPSPPVQVNYEERP
jgi:uncharacterized protein YbcI